MISSSTWFARHRSHFCSAKIFGSWVGVLTPTLNDFRKLLLKIRSSRALNRARVFKFKNQDRNNVCGYHHNLLTALLRSIEHRRTFLGTDKPTKLSALLTIWIFDHFAKPIEALHIFLLDPLLLSLERIVAADFHLESPESIHLHHKLRHVVATSMLLGRCSRFRVYDGLNPSRFFFIIFFSILWCYGYRHSRKDRATYPSSSFWNSYYWHTDHRWHGIAQRPLWSCFPFWLVQHRMCSLLQYSAWGRRGRQRASYQRMSQGKWTSKSSNPKASVCYCTTFWFHKPVFHFSSMPSHYLIDFVFFSNLSPLLVSRPIHPLQFLLLWRCFFIETSLLRMPRKHECCVGRGPRRKRMWLYQREPVHFE